MLYSLHDDNNVVKYTIVPAIPMATTYLSYRLVIRLEITADTLLAAADNRHDFHCAQQPPRSGAAAQPNTLSCPILYPRYHSRIRQKVLKKRVQTDVPMAVARAVAMGWLAAAIVRGERTSENWFKINPW